MKVTVQHATLGEIVYTEGIWSGKKTLTVGGVEAKPISKKDFILNNERIFLKGSYLAGVCLYIGDEVIQIVPRPKWYELILAILPFAFLMVWGNNPQLCAIFPVTGGMLGGAVGGAALTCSLLLMRMQKKPLYKVLVGIAFLAAAILVCYLIALALLAGAGAK